MEPRAPTADPLGPGAMITMVRPDPVVAARALALDLDAELVLGGPATIDLIARLDPPAEAGSGARRAPHPVDRELDQLTAAMRRAEAIREATRDHTARKLSADLNTRIAIHPDTIRRAALELIAARRAVVEDDRAAAQRTRARWSATAALALATALGGAAMAMVAVHRPVLTAVLAGGALGTLGLALLAHRLARDVGERPELIIAVGVAERRWAQVSPRHTAPEAVEQVIHRYEPQHKVVADLIDEHPAVRAVERAVVARRLAWVTAWRDTLGDHGPLAGGPQAHRLPAGARRGTDAAVLLAADAGRASSILVVASPYEGLPVDQALALHRRLLSQPGGRRVIVVLPPDADVPEGAGLPGLGWMPADRAAQAAS